MIAVVIAFAAVLAAMLVLTGIFGKWAKDAIGDTLKAFEDARTEKSLRERTEFERDKQRDGRLYAEHRAAKLEEILGDAMSKYSLGEDLDPDDVAGRVRRIQERWEAERAGDPVPPTPDDGTVPALETTDTPAAAGLRSDPDGLEVP